MTAEELFLNHNRLTKFYKGLDVVHGVILDIIPIDLKERFDHCYFLPEENMGKFDKSDLNSQSNLELMEEIYGLDLSLKPKTIHGIVIGQGNVTACGKEIFIIDDEKHPKFTTDLDKINCEKCRLVKGLKL